MFLKEAQEEWARCQVTLDGLDYVCPWTAPSESASLTKAERNRVLFEYLDDEIEFDKRGSNASMYLRLKFMIREMSSLQSQGQDPLSWDLDKKGWMNDSLVALQAIVDGVDILIIDGPAKPTQSGLSLTLRKADGTIVIVGRKRTKHGYGNATSALQRATVQGNVWSRLSLAVAVGGRISSKGKLVGFLPEGRSQHTKQGGLFARPGCWDNQTSVPDQTSEGPNDPSSESDVEQKPEAATAILRDIWPRVMEYLPYFKVLIHTPGHWHWAYPDRKLGVKERLGRYTPKQLRKSIPDVIPGLSILKDTEWKRLNGRILTCVSKPGLRTPERTGWAYREFMTHEMSWGFHGMPPTKTRAHPRLHHESGVKSLLSAVMAGLKWSCRPASIGCLSDLLVEHIVTFRWLYRSFLGPDDVPRKSALGLLLGSGLPIHAASDPLAVPKGIAVIVVAVSHVFQVDLLLSFHHGGKLLTNRGVETVDPVRMDEFAYQCCTATRMAVPDPLSRTRNNGILHLAWLHVEEQGNNPVFFLLEAGPDRNKLFQVVHKSDDLAHEYDVAAPPTTTALTIYRGDDGLMLLSSGDTRTQMYDVRPSGVVPDDTLFVRWRERAEISAPGTRRSGPACVWTEVIEVRFGCSVKDLKWQEEEDEPPQGGKNTAYNILDHTFNGEGLAMLAKLNRAAGYTALRAHAKHQVGRDDVDAEVLAAMLDDDDATKIVNPPWSACSDFLWEGGARIDRGGSHCMQHKRIVARNSSPRFC